MEGQQIVDVNGHSFLDISHRKAVAIFKSERELILKIQVCLNLKYTAPSFCRI